MISRRNFFSMVIIMLVVLFLFQFSNVAIEAWNDYEDNEYVVALSQLPGRKDAFRSEYQPGSQRPLVVFIGKASSAQGEIVASWVEYTKYSLVTFPTLTLYESSRQDLATPQIIALDGEGMEWQDDSCTLLKNYGDQGSNLVFCSLPDPSVIEDNRELQQLLGIREIKQNSGKVTGIHLYKDFLLGGEVIYKAEDEEEEKKQNMDLNFPWYLLSSGTKVYMRGIPEDHTLKSPDLPAVIWRNSLGNAQVFAVNGSYMSDTAGLGLLTAMTAEMDVFHIYPVVNAQNLVAANYPGLASENGQEMIRYYGQSLRGVFRDIIWPDLVAMYKQNQLGLSCLLAPQFDYKDMNLPDRVQFIYYMKQLNEQGAEAGFSAFSYTDTPVSQKLAEDFQFLEDAQLDYDFTSLFVGDMPEDKIHSALGWEGLDSLRTVVADFDNSGQVVGYQTDTVTRQCSLSDGMADTYMEDFRSRSVETALAYTSVLIDFAQIAYPQSDIDTWDVLSDQVKSDLTRHRNTYKHFQATTVSQCDDLIRDFLALDYVVAPEGQKITLRRNNVEGPSWFILKINGKAVSSVKGGTFTKLEDTAYLIEAVEDSVTIKLRSQLSMEQRNEKD